MHIIIQVSVRADVRVFACVKFKVNLLYEYRVWFSKIIILYETYCDNLAPNIEHHI